jgi:hypothetical protein
MSRSALSSASERIDHISGRWSAQIGLQSLAVNHINRSVEEASDVVLQANVIEERDMGLGIDIDHDIEIAVGPILATRHRAEHGGMRDRARSAFSYRRRVARAS